MICNHKNRCVLHLSFNSVTGRMNVLLVRVGKRLINTSIKVSGVFPISNSWRAVNNQLIVQGCQSPRSQSSSRDRRRYCTLHHNARAVAFTKSRAAVSWPVLAILHLLSVPCVVGVFGLNVEKAFCKQVRAG
jgi:hypothetical protein